MRRSYILIIVVALVTSAAVTLRLRSHVARTPPPVVTDSRPATAALALPIPRDYVTDPWVFPDEADCGPQRIISLAPSVTELVCALGLRGRLVGRTQFCRYPPDVESVPAVGALMDTSFERIRALRPDLVLVTSNSSPVIDALSKLSIAYADVPHESVDDLFDAVEKAGNLAARPKTAGALVACIRADLRAVEAAAQTLNLPNRRLLIVLGQFPPSPRPLWVAGPGSFLDELIRSAGQTNAAAAVVKSAYQELPLEKLAAIDADAILTFGPEPSPQQWNDLYQAWAPLESVAAVRARRIRWVGPDEWLSTTPRLPILLHRIVMVLSNLS